MGGGLYHIYEPPVEYSCSLDMRGGVFRCPRRQLPRSPDSWRTEVVRPSGSSRLEEHLRRAVGSKHISIGVFGQSPGAWDTIHSGHPESWHLLVDGHGAGHERIIFWSPTFCKPEFWGFTKRHSAGAMQETMKLQSAAQVVMARFHNLITSHDIRMDCMVHHLRTLFCGEPQECSRGELSVLTMQDII